MKLKLDWAEFVGLALDGLNHRGYEVKGFPEFLSTEGILPQEVEIEVNKRKLPHEISIL